MQYEIKFSRSISIIVLSSCPSILIYVYGI
uniref:Uncharacterized protein n=1 Tax=Heterorhabditis bacteriophora TaxID=37862 RepID=A0A1I7WKX6_HETBA